MERIEDRQRSWERDLFVTFAALIALVGVFAVLALATASPVHAAESVRTGFPDGMHASGIYAVDGGYGLVDAAYADLRATLARR